MLTGIHLSGLCLLSRGGWGWRWLPQVRRGWLAGRPFDLRITCTGWAPHQAGASDGASHHGGAERSDGCRFLLFLIIEHKAAFFVFFFFLADESASSS